MARSRVLKKGPASKDASSSEEEKGSAAGIDGEGGTAARGRTPARRGSKRAKKASRKRAGTAAAVRRKKARKSASRKAAKKATRTAVKRAAKRTDRGQGRAGGIAAGRDGRASGRGGSTTLRNASIEQLQQEITRRESQLAALEIERVRLANAMASLDETLAGLGGNHFGRGNHQVAAAGGRRGRRAGNGMSLVEAMQQVLPNAIMSVAEIGDAVRAIGYETSSRNFRTVITNALGKHTHLFKKVSRGRYTVC